MPLASIKEQLIKATREGYAVPLFNVFDPIAVVTGTAAVVVPVGGRVPGHLRQPLL